MILKNEKNKSLRHAKGSVMAEAALTIPILVGISFVIIEFGNVLYLSNSINQIGRSAARYASVTLSYTQQDLINASGASSIIKDVSKLTLTISPTIGTTRSVGTTITVTAQYSYTPILNPFALLNSSNSWAPTVKSVAVARCEVAGT